MRGSYISKAQPLITQMSAFAAHTPCNLRWAENFLSSLQHFQK